MKSFLVSIIRFYQSALSPIIHVIFIGGCKFQPTCSEYGIQAIKKFGAIKGGWMALRRIFRCHPWSEGGVDMP